MLIRNITWEIFVLIPQIIPVLLIAWKLNHPRKKQFILGLSLLIIAFNLTQSIEMQMYCLMLIALYSLVMGIVWKIKSLMIYGLVLTIGFATFFIYCDFVLPPDA
ncbi:hypothetical protein [Companilactobacillus mishanensis]|uniref:Uncharacterized protein n=1 Tax=Companilactobacillus mishanensis TaxID=2486008 RepID=A0ABW9P8I0_9LACO|nr:hypothetical protein [Companilactobacillus mishanensis]MQS45588.1 hypothetical protein [Companilactobacillus mishanensis]